MRHQALAIVVMGFWTVYQDLWEAGYTIVAILLAAAFSFAYDWYFTHTWVERKKLGEIADRLEAGLHGLRTSLSRYMRAKGR